MPITQTTNPNGPEKNLTSMAEVKVEIPMPTLSDTDNARIQDALVRGSFFYEMTLAGKRFGFGTLSTDQVMAALRANVRFRRKVESDMRADMALDGIENSDIARISKDDIDEVAGPLGAADLTARHIRTIDGEAVTYQDAAAYIGSLSPIITQQIFNFIQEKNQQVGKMVYIGISTESNIKKS